MGLSLFLIGFISLSSQIIFLRELLIVFYGNEIILGLLLGIWLITGGIGSIIAAKLIRKKSNPPIKFFIFFQFLVSAYLILCIYFIRMLPRLLNLFPGEITNEFTVIISAFAIILPLNGLLGALFACGCAIYKNRQGIISAGYVYIFESAGAFAGSCFTIFFLLPGFDSFQCCAFLSVINLLSIIISNSRPAARSAALLFSALNVFLFFNTENLTKNLINKAYPGHNVVFYRNTHYQNLMVLEGADSLSLYTSGIYNYSTSDIAAAEMTAHLPLAQTENPRKILLIGGGMSPVTGEILKHPVKELCHIELDPALAQNLKEYFPAQEDLRNKTIISDARCWLSKTSEKFDLIILMLPPPHTLLINRYYTLEFFDIACRHLNNNGILSFSMPSQPSYLSTEHRMFFLSLKKTLLKIFPEILITPGETAFFLASKKEGTLTPDWQLMLERLRKKEISTDYFREYYLCDRLSQEGFNTLSNQLKMDTPAQVNSDFHPISHFYNSILWSTHFKRNIGNHLKKLNPVNISAVFVLLYALLLYPVYRKRPATLYRFATITTTTGFSEMSFQIITILIFQIFYGSVFWEMSLIFASYMLGLIAGCSLATRLIKKKPPRKRWLINSQIAISVYPLLLIGAMFLFRNTMAGKTFLIIMPLIPGLIGGIQFQLVCGLYNKKHNDSTGKIGGYFYGFDLVGSFFGSVIVSIIIIPVLGILPAVILSLFLGTSGIFLAAGI